MSVLYIGLLVFAYVGASSGDDGCKGSPEIPVFGAPGGHVLLQLEESERALCLEKCQIHVKKNSWSPVTKTWIPTSETSTECRFMRPNCNVFTNGSLQLSHVTPQVSGNYSLTLESNGACKFEKYFRVHIQDPVSVPQMNYTCQRNSSVHLSCFAESGTDPSYSWHVNGTPTWTLTKEILTEYKSVLRHVTCTVKNKVSEEQSQPTDITCPETTTTTPTPTPTPTTLSTDFSSTWSPAINSTGNSTASSKGCVTWKGLTCVQWSAIGAAGILSMTVLPLIIGVLCTMPRKADL